MNLRKRYNKEKARINKSQKSGISSAECDAIKGELRLQFLQWIDPFLKPRKTCTNFRTTLRELANSDILDDEGEESDIDEDTVETISREITQENDFDVEDQVESISGSTSPSLTSQNKMVRNEIFLKQQEG